MKRVYTSESAAMAWHMRNVLEQHEITAVVRNDKLYSVAGEVPFVECMTEVWVVQKLDYQRAERIIRELELPDEPSGPDWLCRNCGESNASSYAICWSCEGSHD